ncbi:MAG: transposase, partial [Dehalococcoidales bacterium]|nr:transposase [Dehalococcoidales bacterium]
KISQRLRKRIEHLFAEAKELMGLRRARRRGIAQVLEQCLMTAMVQNIKCIVKAIDRSQNGIPAIVERSAYLSRHIYEFLSKQMTAFINIFMQVPSFIFRKEFTATIYL